jgi:hypothetical protein
MRRLVVHSVGVIALAMLMALLVPSSDQQLQYRAASLVTNLSVAGVSGHAARPVSTAVSDGRWKLGGDGSCYWDPDDAGPDQCSQTPTGRWKLGGDGSCYWDANDSGADQCAPPAPSPAAEARAFSSRAKLRPGA